jgi:hypothetical protein
VRLGISSHIRFRIRTTCVGRRPWPAAHRRGLPRLLCGLGGLCGQSGFVPGAPPTRGSAALFSLQAPGLGHVK